jgi:hypothetical protein
LEPTVALPYENATSGEKASADLQKILHRFGCDRFGTMIDHGAGELICQFSYRGRDVLVKASIRGYAAAWLKEHPYGPRSRSSKSEYERKGLEIAGLAVYSILRDWIKGQITAVETGILSFEGAFLAQLVLPSGRTVFDTATGPSGILKLDNKVASIKGESHGS